MYIYEVIGKYSLVYFWRSLAYETSSREAAKEISLAESWISAKYQTASVTRAYRSGQLARQIEKAESPSAIRAMLDLDTIKIKAEEIYMYT